MIRHLLSSDGDQLTMLIDEINCPFSTSDILRSVSDSRYDCLVSEAYLSEGPEGLEGLKDTRTLHGQLTGVCFSRAIAGVVELFFIGVLPEYRQKKIATNLLQQLIKNSVALHAQCIELEVRVSNVAATSLYQGFGFTVQGRRENYYPANDTIQQAREAALLLTLNL